MIVQRIPNINAWTAKWFNNKLRILRKFHHMCRVHWPNCMQDQNLIALVSSYYLWFRLDLMTLYYTYFILCTSCDRLSRLPTYAFPHAHLDTFSITSLSKSPAPCFSLVFWYICHCIFTIHFQLHLAISAVASCYIFCCISSGIPCHLSATYQITYPATSPVTVLIHCYTCGHHITSYDLCCILSLLRVSNTFLKYMLPLHIGTSRCCLTQITKSNWSNNPPPNIPSRIPPSCRPNLFSVWWTAGRSHPCLHQVCVIPCCEGMRDHFAPHMLCMVVRLMHRTCTHVFKNKWNNGKLWNLAWCVAGTHNHNMATTARPVQCLEMI